MFFSCRLCNPVIFCPEDGGWSPTIRPQIFTTPKLRHGYRRVARRTHTNSRVRKQAAYVKPNNVALSRDHCCCGNTTMHSVPVAEHHVTVDGIKILSIAQECFCCKFMLQATLKRELVLMLSARCCTETKECSFAHDLP
jgi:hypothetical protein